MPIDTQDDQATVECLVAELQVITQDPNGDRHLQFSALPFDAFTLVAVLQAASRHPSLSDIQQDVVDSFAHQIADQLVDIARAVIGKQTTLEETIARGFDPAYDR